METDEASDETGDTWQYYSKTPMQQETLSSNLVPISDLTFILPCVAGAGLVQLLPASDWCWAGAMMRHMRQCDPD